MSPRIARAAREARRQMHFVAPPSLLIGVGVMAVVSVKVDGLVLGEMVLIGLACGVLVTALAVVESFVSELLFPSDASDASTRR